MRISFGSIRWVLVVVVAVAIAAGPYRALAQQPAATTDGASQVSSVSSPGSGAGSGAASAQQKPDEKLSQEDQEKAFLHSSAVQALARMLHLDVETTSRIFLGINFAVIFFAIAIPLVRVMPKIFRKRKQTLSQDLTTARQATADANSRLSAVEAKLAGLDEEMKAFRAQVDRDLVEDEKRIKASIGEESARIVAAAEQEIGAAAAQARRGLRNFAADLAIEHAEKSLVLTAETDRALIAEFVAGVSADGAGKGGKS